MEIDHVVLAARTKADAEEVLSRAGLGIARGRTIPGLGLSNLVVPLRHGQLLEIHYPNGEASAPTAPPLLEFDKEALAAYPSQPLVPMAWLLVVDDEQRLREVAATNEMSVVEAPAEGPGFPPYVLAGFGANFAGASCPASSTGRKALLSSAPSTAANPSASPASMWPARPTLSKAGAEEGPTACTPCPAPRVPFGSRSVS